MTADGEFLDTEKIIQVIFALLPEAMLAKMDAQADPSNKVFTYSQKGLVLKLFQRLVEDGPSDVYKCFLDLAPEAWKLLRSLENASGIPWNSNPSD